MLPGLFSALPGRLSHQPGGLGRKRFGETAATVLDPFGTYLGKGGGTAAVVEPVTAIDGTGTAELDAGGTAAPA